VDITDAFTMLQKNVNAPTDAVERARERRDLFRKAFAPEEDVVEVFASGSFARGNQRDPINESPRGRPPGEPLVLPARSSDYVCRGSARR
jgi:hypothetical protein